MNKLIPYTTEALMAEGARRLKNSKITSAMLDSRILLSYAASCSSEELVLKRKEPLPSYVITKFFRLIERRRHHEPVAHIVQKKEFYEIDFEVNKNVLIPRPDSETLIDLAQFYFKSKLKNKISILDLGTGSGCLVLTLLNIFSNSKGVGVDISNKALQVAKKNAKKLNLNKRISFIEANWSDLKFNNKFDLVISNPPYIKSNDISSLQKNVKNYEPLTALNGGEDGLDCYRKIFSILKNFLNPSGICIFEIGDKQFNSISKIANNYNFETHKLQKDLSGKIRAMSFIYSS